MKLTNICTNCQTVENEGAITIFSYGTPVLLLAPHYFYKNYPNIYNRLWSGYSATTLRHINKVLNSMEFSPIRKAEWDAMSVVGVQ